VSPRSLNCGRDVGWGMRKLLLTVGVILVSLAIGASSCSNNAGNNACAQAGGLNHTSTDPYDGQPIYYCNNGSQVGS
jgi:hypothetical protein